MIAFRRNLSTGTTRLALSGLLLSGAAWGQATGDAPADPTTQPEGKATPTPSEKRPEESAPTEGAQSQDEALGSDTGGPDSSKAQEEVPETSAPEGAPAPAEAVKPSSEEAPEAVQAEAVQGSAPTAEPTSPSAASAAPVDPIAESAQPPTDDDYAGASDAALVEEKPEPKDLSFGVALDLTLPMGNSAKFIERASIQGLSLDLRYYAFGNIGIGAGVALDSLSTKVTETVTWDNATFTGTQVRELSFTPITAKGYYAWRDSGRVVPYVAAGVGAARSVRRLVVGISGLSEAAWHFAMVPEAGLQIPAGPTIVLTNVRLNYLPASGGVESQMFANFSLGLSIQ